MKRSDGRVADELRPVKIHPHYVEAPAGSVLIEMGKTRVLCAVSVEETVPRWMRDQGVSSGWITAEYSMLPCASAPRKPREVTRGRPEGRTQEIQRLIGRSLRAAVDLEKLGARTLWVDCDVLQADGGTRAAAITGASVALALAVQRLQQDAVLIENPIRGLVAAVSAGLVDGCALSMTMLPLRSVMLAARICPVLLTTEASSMSAAGALIITVPSSASIIPLFMI